MHSDPHDVGPFRLTHLLGRGGMGAVWAGAHRATGQAVAVKLLHARLARQPALREAFATEVRAVARLRHPHVVTVLDHGVLAEGAPPVGAAGPGSPWLAMEPAPGQPWSRLLQRLDWPALARVLRAVLGALAHAHARGVLHRDLKPGNVMVADRQVVLLDFGISRITPPDGLAGAPDHLVGTPGTMAPEQFTGDDWRLGPWTDLYGLGCATWAALTGAPPFGRGRPLLAIAHDHLHAPLPPLPAGVGAPAALEEWLRRLLAKDPTERFQTAAVARAALDAIPGAPPGLPAPAPAQPALSGGAGLRLFGLRAVPLVGRQAEQARLLRALERSLGGEAQAVVLEGAAGAGKTALARWLCAHAHEHGVALPVVARWTPGGSAGDGLGRGLARWLRCAGGSIEHRLDRVHAVAIQWDLGPEETRDLQALVGAAAGPRFSGPRQRHAAAARVLARAASHHPLVLHLEDVHWGPDGLDLVAEALPRWRAAGARVLVLATARPWLPEAPVAAAAGRAAAAGAQSLAVGPVAPGFRGALIQQHLPLHRRLVQEVERRTAGNPLFVQQLLGDWVERAVLEPRRGGLALRPGARATLPDDLHAVWQARVQRALPPDQPQARDAVELLALLGQSVDRGEWARACRHAGIAAAASPVEGLLTSGLLHPGPAGARHTLTFAHAMLRESLVREAEARGWAAAARRAIAAALQDDGPPEGQAALRLGRVLVALGQDDAAVEPLTRGAWACVRDSEFLQAAEALAERAAALARCAPGPTDRRPCAGWIMAARVARRQGDLAAASRFTTRAARAAAAQGWPDLRCQALRERARLDAHAGRRRAAHGALTEACRLSAQVDDPMARAWCQRDLGLARVAAGAGPDAVDGLLAAAQRAFLAEDEAYGAATALLGRAKARAAAGQARAARPLLAAAAAAFRASASLQEPAHAWAGLSEVAHLLGRPAAGLRHGAQALARFQAIGTPAPPATTLRHAAALLEAGHPDAAGALLDPLVRALAASRRPGMLAPALAHVAWRAAATGQADACRGALRQARRLSAAIGTAEPAGAHACARAAQAARSQDLLTLAGEAGALARALRAS